jgi:type IV pilus assembly protein PilO
MAREALLQAVWRTNRILPIVLGLLLLVGVLLLGINSLVVTPRLENLERDFIRRQEAYRQARLAGESADTPEALFRQGQADLETFRQAIPPRGDFPALVGDVFDLAGITGLTIDRIEYAPKILESEGLLQYSLTFNVGGSYGQIKKFVYLLEHSTRLIAIEELALNSAQTPDTISLRLKLATYFRMDEE